MMDFDRESNYESILSEYFVPSLGNHVATGKVRPFPDIACVVVQPCDWLLQFRVFIKIKLNICCNYWDFVFHSDII